MSTHKCINGGTDLLLRSHSFFSFDFRASRETSKMDQIEKSKGLRSGLLAGHNSLLMKDGIFLWIHVCVILEPCDSAESSCWRLHGNPWKWLSAQGSKWDSKMSETYRSEFNFAPEGTKTSGDLPDGVTAAQIITDCGYWRLVAILPLTELEEPQTRSFCWLTTYCMSNFFLSMNTKLGTVPWSISSRIWRLLSILILLWCSVNSWRWSIL